MQEINHTKKLRIRACLMCGLTKKIHAHDMCDLCYRRDRHKKYPEIENTRRKRYAQEHPDKLYRNSKWYTFRYNLRYHYNLSIEDYYMMWLEQDGKCDICHREVELQVDHDHATHRVRGLLCVCCNLTVGRIHENVETAQRLVQYLKKHKQIEMLNVPKS